MASLDQRNGTTDCTDFRDKKDISTVNPESFRGKSRQDPVRQRRNQKEFNAKAQRHEGAKIWPINFTCGWPALAALRPCALALKTPVPSVVKPWRPGAMAEERGASVLNLPLRDAAARAPPSTPALGASSRRRRRTVATCLTVNIQP